MRLPWFLSCGMWLVILASATATCCILSKNNINGIYVLHENQGAACADVPSPMYNRSEIPFSLTVTMECRRVWTGMRGGRSNSTSLGRKKIRCNEFRSGSAYDVQMFLWLQLCMSGFPPHPGPSESESSSGTQAALRVTCAKGATSSNRGVSLYDVYAEIIPGKADLKTSKQYLKRLHDKPEWLTEWLQRRSLFEQGTSTGCNASPALHSLLELHKFITYVYHLQFKFPRRQLQIRLNVKQFFTVHAAQLAKVWPHETKFEPTFLHLDPPDPPSGESTPTASGGGGIRCAHSTGVMAAGIS
eukprot:4088010-Pyramimonas_sp.AAC.1